MGRDVKKEGDHRKREMKKCLKGKHCFVKQIEKYNL